MKLRFFLRKEIIIILIFSLLSISCSTTYVCNTYEEANEKIGKGSVEVYLNSGKFYYAKDVKAGKDSTRLFDKTNEQIVYVSTKDIKIISEANHLYGFFEGIMIGGGIGYLAGSLYDLKTKKSNDFPLAWVLASFGVFTGILYGTGIGHHYYYILPDSSAPADSRDSVTTNTGVILK